MGRQAAGDPRRSQDIIDFFSNLTVPTGKLQGSNINLLPFQKNFLKDVYDNIEKKTGERRTRKAFLSMPRKNGKTTIIAGLALAHLIGPEAGRNREIICAANDADQAGIVYTICKQFIEYDPVLSEYLKCVDHTKIITAHHLGSRIKAISASPRSKHGFNPSVVIYDELGQSRGRELYEVLETSQSAQHEPLFFAIGTQSNDPRHVFSEVLDDGLTGRDKSIVAHLYSADEDCDLLDRTQWKKSNPALGKFRDYTELKKSAESAVAMPSKEASFRNLYLNQRVNPESPLLARSTWMNCAGDAKFVDKEKIFLGLDLSKTTDLTALVAVSCGEKSKIQAWFWKPQDRIAKQSIDDFGSGSTQYQRWVDEGYLLGIPGAVIHTSHIAQVLEMLLGKYTVCGLAYDRYGIANLMTALEDQGIETSKGDKGSGLKMYDWGQGFRDMAPAIKALEEDVLSGSLIHDQNPILTWNVANAIAISDPAGNRKLDKSKTRFRIDGAVAMAMAVGIKHRLGATEDSGSLSEYLASLEDA